MIRALILSGGVSHDFDASSAALQGVLAAGGIGAEIEGDINAGMARLDDYQVLVLNALRWSMTNAERYAALRPRWGYEVNATMREGMARHRGRGGGVYGLHAASICFDDWPEWRDILGAAWRWEASRHDPPGPAHVTFDGAHPLTDGLRDFTVVDEIYTGLDLAPGADPLAWATQDGEAARHPVLLARETAGARVIYDALGHDPRSIEQPVHAQLIRRGMRWVAGLDPKGDDSDA